MKNFAYLALGLGLLAPTMTAQAALLNPSPDYSAPNCVTTPAGRCATNAK
jgi:hypothetical protein